MIFVLAAVRDSSELPRELGGGAGEGGAGEIPIPSPEPAVASRTAPTVPDASQLVSWNVVYVWLSLPHALTRLHGKGRDSVRVVVRKLSVG